MQDFTSLSYQNYIFESYRVLNEIKSHDETNLKLHQIHCMYLTDCLKEMQERMYKEEDQPQKRPRVDSPPRPFGGKRPRQISDGKGPRILGGKSIGALMRSSSEEEEEEEEESEESEVEQAPKTTLELTRDANGAISGKRFVPVVTKDNKAKKQQRLKEQIRDMRVQFGFEGAKVTITPEIYRTVYDRIKHNLDIPHATPYTELMMLVNHNWVMPKESFTIRLPVQTIHQANYKLRGEDAWCKACDRKLKEGTGRYVRTLVCSRTKMHDECAAVVIHAIGYEFFYECMFRMSKNPKRKANANGKVPLKCRHIRINDKELLKEIELAKREFIPNYSPDRYQRILEVAAKKN